MKRLTDLLCAVLALTLCAPLLLAVAVAIRFLMGAPVFFRQLRPGLKAKPFRLIKFRTMRPAQEGELGPQHDLARLGHLGRLLRATSLDELPTLWNVVRGDMSLVGPRPLLMEYLPRYTAEQARRHEVRPGITGWAQVNGRNAITWEEKFKLDVWYVDHVTIWLDMKILLMTIWKVFKREGVSAEGHATMPEFLGSEHSDDTQAKY